MKFNAELTRSLRDADATTTFKVVNQK